MKEVITEVSLIISYFSDIDCNMINIHNSLTKSFELLKNVSDNSTMFSTWRSHVTELLYKIKVALFNNKLEDIRNYVLDQRNYYVEYED